MSTSPASPTDPTPRPASLKDMLDRYRLPLWLLAAALCIVMSSAGNMHRGLLETTEGRYAECAREMFETGNYLVPTLNYEPHWTKPPMAYWSMAAGMALLGPNEPGVRLAGAAAFVITACAAAWIAAILWNQTAAWLTLVLFSSSLLPVLGATMLSTDMLLTMWETLAVACYVAWTDRQRTGWTVAMWLFFGLAFLTKGPPALLPLLGLIPWHIHRYRNARIVPWQGLLGFLLVAGSWFAAVIWKHPDLFHYYIHEEVVNRLTSNDFHRNPQWYAPLYIFLPVLFLGQLHWLWQSCERQCRNIRNLPRDKRLLLTLWFALPLVVFSLAKSRLPLYVLPLTVPLTVLMAGALTDRAAAIPGRRVLLTALAAMVVLLTARTGAGLWPLPQNMRQLHAAISATTEQNATVVAIMKKPAYGLQFYTGARLQWINGSQQERSRGLDDFLKDATTPFCIVTTGDDASWISNMLHTQERSGVLADAGTWKTITVPAAKAF